MIQYNWKKYYRSFCNWYIRGEIQITFCVGGSISNLLERIQERAQNNDRCPDKKIKKMYDISHGIFFTNFFFNFDIVINRILTLSCCEVSLLLSQTPQNWECQPTKNIETAEQTFISFYFLS